MRPSLRFDILIRDGFRCRYCGRSADDGAKLQIDHLHPRKHGGLDEPSNLVTACWDCNSGKSAKVLRPVPKRGYRLRMPSVAPELPPPSPEWPEGAHCVTPLKIAAIGYQMGWPNYASAYRHIAKIPVPESYQPPLPPLRRSDYGWYQIVRRDPEVIRPMMERLAAKIFEPQSTN